MTDLKTLNGIEDYQDSDCYHEGAVGRDRLKAEAVKWVKELRTTEFIPTIDYGYPLYEMEKAHKLTLSSWIISFFNLTEEDLK